jgi:selenocysteine lyase/cysteine desulfurase
MLKADTSELETDASKLEADALELNAKVRISEALARALVMQMSGISVREDEIMAYLFRALVAQI